MKDLKTLLIVFSTVMFFTACKKEESTSLWNISGKVIMKDEQAPEITTPLEGINVYLLKAPFTMDTITHWYAKTDILDSTLTDANGLYTFSQIQVGNYTVMPTDTSARYVFDWSESPDPIWVLADNTKKEFTMNFTTPEPIMESSAGDFIFKMYYVFDNPYGKDDRYMRRVSIFRTTRDWKYLRWHWGPVFGWGDWYWSEVSTELIPLMETWPLSITKEVKKNNNHRGVEYTNEFHLKFYVDYDFHVYTYAVGDVKDENSYDIMWTLNFGANVGSVQVGIPDTVTRFLGDSFKGGIIAYMLQPDDQGYDAHLAHGIIAAPSDQSTGEKWLAADSICSTLELNGYNDWYLPSKDELNKLYELHLLGFGGFASDSYWSNNREQWSQNYWAQAFYDGYQYVSFNNNELRVRAVRAF